MWPSYKITPHLCNVVSRVQELCSYKSLGNVGGVIEPFFLDFTKSIKPKHEFMIFKIAFKIRFFASGAKNTFTIA